MMKMYLILAIGCLLPACRVDKLNKEDRENYIDGIKMVITRDLKVGHGDLVLLGEDFARSREPVVGFVIEQGRLPNNLVDWSDRAEESSSTDELRRANHYLMAIGQGKVIEISISKGLFVVRKSTYSYILIYINDGLLVLYLGGVV